MKKGFSDFCFFFRNKVWIEKMCRILENLRKTFFYWKKIQLQVSKWGVFWGKKSKSAWVAGTFFHEKTVLRFFIFFFRNKVWIEKMCCILENLRKTFFYWKKIQLQVSKWGVFWGKKSKSAWVAGTFFRKKHVLWFLWKFTELKFR